MNRKVLWLLVALGGVACGLVAVVVAALVWLGTSDFDVPYQDARQLQGPKVEATCQDCLVLQAPNGGAGPAQVTIRLTDSTRYDNHRSFPAGELVTAWVIDTPNPDGSWTAIEVNHGTGSSRRGT